MDLIIGAGSVGTVIAALLIKSGRNVRLYVRPEKKHAFNGDEVTLNLSYKNAHIKTPSPEIVDIINLENIEYVFIAVKHRSLEEVFSLLPQSIAKTTTLVPCLNGALIKEKFASRFPDTRILPMTVMFNARLDSPLQVNITTSPQILVQEPKPELTAIFKRAGIQARLGNSAQEWGKLLINLNNAICTLTYTTFKDTLTNRYLRQVLAALLSESTLVLDKANIAYRLPTPLPIPISAYRWFLTRSKILPQIIGKLLSRVSEKSYPSMVADIENNVITEIDQINGELLELAHSLNLSMPVNQKIITMVKELEQQRNKTFITPQQLALAVL